MVHGVGSWYTGMVLGVRSIGKRYGAKRRGIAKRYDNRRRGIGHVTWQLGLQPRPPGSTIRYVSTALRMRRVSTAQEGRRRIGYRDEHHGTLSSRRLPALWSPAAILIIAYAMSVPLVAMLLRQYRTPHSNV
eukprot:3940262-Rhodomonas_salina.2